MNFSPFLFFYRYIMTLNSLKIDNVLFTSIAVLNRTSGPTQQGTQNRNHIMVIFFFFYFGGLDTYEADKGGIYFWLKMEGSVLICDQVMGENQSPLIYYLISFIYRRLKMLGNTAVDQ